MSQIFKNKKFIITAFTVLFLTTCAFLFYIYRSDIIGTSAAGENWLTGWSKRKPITVSNTNPTGKQGTIYGNPTLGASGKFGTATSFDGSGDYISFPTSDDWNFGSGDFTIDAWVYKRTRDDDYNFIASSRGEDGNGWYLASGVDAGNADFYDQNGTCRVLSSSPISLNVWTHIAVVREGSIVKMYLNGQLSNSASCTGSLVVSSSPLGVGARYPGVNYIDASIDEFRISKGIARWTAPFTPPVSAYTSDEHDRLLLHLDETTGTTAYSSDWGSKSGTASGNPIFGPAGKFGTTTNFDGVNDYISFPDSDDWDLDGDFTIDFWIKTASPSTYQFPIVHRNYGNTAGMFQFYIESSKINFNSYNSSDSQTAGILQSGTILANTWYHVAVVRSGSTATMYINGTSVSTDSTASGSISGDPSSLILGYLINYGAYFNGSLDEFRLSKGIARWTSNFTPPTSAYTADQYDKLLLHFNESGGTTAYSSDSGSKTGTISGAPIMGKFGGAITFDGTGDYVSVPASGDWNFGTSDFTIDMWYSGTPAARNTLISWGDNSSSPSLDFWIGSDTLGVQINNGTVSAWSSALTWTAGTYYHLALVRRSGIFYVYRDGVQVATDASQTSLSVDMSSLAPRVGAQTRSGYPDYCNGTIDELRVSKGIARWTGAFSVPTAAYTADQYDELLMHFGENGGLSASSADDPRILTDHQVKISIPYNSSIKSDYSDVRFTSSDGSTLLSSWMEDYSTNKTGTIANTPTLGASGKFGTAISFDGSDDYISIPDSDDWNFGSGDFTIDFWISPTSLSSAHGYLGQTNGGSAEQGFYIYRDNGTNKLYFRWRATDGERVGYQLSWTPTLSWHHLAFVRNGTTFSVYIDGVAQSLTTEVAISTRTLNNCDGNLFIGKDSNGFLFNGAIDELRISKGTARWTGAFSVPTAAYTADAQTKLLVHLDETSGTSATSNNSTASFWVKNSLLPLGDTTIYMYYGKSDAIDASSGDNTFVFFDDFNDLSKWTQQAGTWSVASGILTSANTDNSYLRATSQLSLTDNFVAEERFKPNSASQGGNILTKGTNPLSYNPSYWFASFGNGALNPLFYIDQSGNHGSGAALPSGVWYRGKVAISTSSSHATYIYSDGGTLLASKTGITADSSSTGNYFGFLSDSTYPYNVDRVFFRKYVPNEPTVSFGTEEGLPTVSITSVAISTTDEDICVSDSGNTICKSGQPVTFTSVATGDVEIKLYICKDSACTNCGISSTSNCWAYSSSYAASNPSAIYDSSCYSGSCGTGECEYNETPNQYWAEVCGATVCSSIIDYENNVVP